MLSSLPMMGTPSSGKRGPDRPQIPFRTVKELKVLIWPPNYLYPNTIKDSWDVNGLMSRSEAPTPIRASLEVPGPCPDRTELFAVMIGTNMGDFDVVA